MNKRVARKIVRKYGDSWVGRDMECREGVWYEVGDSLNIPSRWFNKTIVKLMKQRFCFFNFIKVRRVKADE